MFETFKMFQNKKKGSVPFQNVRNMFQIFSAISNFVLLLEIEALTGIIFFERALTGNW